MRQAYLNLRMIGQHSAYKAEEARTWKRRFCASMPTWPTLKMYRKLLRCIKMTSRRKQALKLSHQDRANWDPARAPIPA